MCIPAPSRQLLGECLVNYGHRQIQRGTPVLHAPMFVGQIIDFYMPIFCQRNILFSCTIGRPRSQIPGSTRLRWPTAGAASLCMLIIFSNLPVVQSVMVNV